jgi:hypothetical protein
MSERGEMFETAARQADGALLQVWTKHTHCCLTYDKAYWSEAQRRLWTFLGTARALAYVPGVWRCPRCHFTLHRHTISAQTGEIAVDTRDERPLCPNEGTPLRRVTWREDAEETAALLVEERARRRMRERELASVVAMLREPRPIVAVSELTREEIG